MVQTYTFDKQEVLNTLRTNRDNHRAIFLEALEGYKVTAISEFQKRIAAIRDGKLISYVSLQLPQDQTKDYNRVIALLEKSKGNDIELSEEQFTNYMLDDWSWKKSFLTNNSYYSSTAAKLADDDDQLETKKDRAEISPPYFYVLVLPIGFEPITFCFRNNYSSH